MAGLDLHIRIAGSKETAEAFTRAGSKVREAVKDAIGEGAELVRQRARATTMSGGIVKSRTGQLKNKLAIAFDDGTSMRSRNKGGHTIAAEVFSEAANPSRNYRGGRYGFILAAGVGKHVIRVGGRRDKSLDSKARRFWIDPKTGKVRRRTRTVVKGYAEGYKRVHHITPRPFLEAAFTPVRDTIARHIQYAVEDALHVSGDFERGGD